MNTSTKATTVLATTLTRPSYQDMIRARSIEGLGQSALTEAFPLVEDALKPSSSFQVRRAAVQALAQLGEGTVNARRARDRLEAALLDTDFRVRMQAGLALLDLGRLRGETTQLRERLERLEEIKVPSLPTPDKSGPKSPQKRPRPDTHRSGCTAPSRVRKK